jgi:hypothetical protein
LAYAAAAAARQLDLTVGWQASKIETTDFTHVRPDAETRPVQDAEFPLASVK